MRAAVLAALLVLAAPAAPADGLSVELDADLARLPSTPGPALLSLLVRVNVISANCPGYEISDGEWLLLTRSADHLADGMGLSVERYDDDFYRPAFALLDAPESCARFGPRVRPVIDSLIAKTGAVFRQD